MARRECLSLWFGDGTSLHGEASVIAIKEVCRMALTTDLSNRQIGQRLGIAYNTVRRYRRRLAEEGLTWTDVEALDEQSLERRINDGRSRRRRAFIEPDWSHTYAEMQRRGVTLTLLHEEYAEGLVNGAMSETEFRRRYRRYQRSRGLVMRQVHRPGECLYLDFSGVRPYLTDLATGEQTPVELFVAALGASRRTFVRAVASQKLPDWIEANAQALAFFGGVPTFLVPDNLKSAVTSHRRRETVVLNPTFAEFAVHYGTMILPARPHRPKDKAHVELAVKIAQRWILARLRNRVFTNLHDLNEAISKLLEVMNAKPMRSCGGKSRDQLFDELDRPALQPLPVEPYAFAEWKIDIRVGRDYHVRWTDQYYSVPYTLVGTKVNVKATAATISVFHRDRRVALHPRSSVPGHVSTLKEHQPKSHQAYSRDQPAAVMAWAQQAGTAIHNFLHQHIERYGRSALSLQAGRGLQRLAREFGEERLEAACERALQIHATSIKTVRSLLRHGLEKAPVDTEAANDDPLPAHENVRGPSYYQP